jgi:hypothetical protein
MSPRLWIRLVLLSGLVTVLGFVLPGWTQASKGKKSALLVGVKSYDHRKVTDLLGQLLTRAGDSEVVLLPTSRGERTRDLQPTRANIAQSARFSVVAPRCHADPIWCPPLLRPTLRHRGSG